MKDGVISFDHHVHYYDAFDIDALLDACHQQLLNACGPVSPEAASPTLAICLLESRGSDHFRALSNEQLSATRWKLKEILVPERLLVMSQGSNELHIISGVQLNSSEGVEVLIFGDTAVDYEAKPLFELIETMISSHVMLLPWAVGKWLGGRGKLIDAVLDRFGNQLLIGDNSGRPALWKNIRQFVTANSRSIPILPGSDPLPLAGEEKRAGSNGVIVRGQLRDAADLDSFLQRSTFCNTISTFETRASLLQFAQQQLALRFTK